MLFHLTSLSYDITYSQLLCFIGLSRKTISYDGALTALQLGKIKSETKYKFLSFLSRIIVFLGCRVKEDFERKSIKCVCQSVRYSVVYSKILTFQFSSACYHLFFVFKISCTEVGITQ